MTKPPGGTRATRWQPLHQEPPGATRCHQEPLHQGLVLKVWNILIFPSLEYPWRNALETILGACYPFLFLLNRKTSFLLKLNLEVMKNCKNIFLRLSLWVPCPWPTCSLGRCPNSIPSLFLHGLDIEGWQGRTWMKRAKSTRWRTELSVPAPIHQSSVQGKIWKNPQISGQMLEKLVLSRRLQARLLLAILPFLGKITLTTYIGKVYLYVVLFKCQVGLFSGLTLKMEVKFIFD